MKKCMYPFLIVLLIVWGEAVFAADASCDDLIAQSEQLWLENDYTGSDNLLDQAMQQCPERAELFWRKSRNEYDRIEAIPRDKKPGKEELIKRYRAMEALAESCMERDPNDGNCLLWKGIAMGRRGTTQGVLKSLSDVDKIEAFWLKAETLNPHYRAANGSANALGDTYTALGQLYRVVPTWLCIFPFKQIFGACGDIEKSVSYQRKAVVREPKRIEYAKELAVSLLCYGQRKDDLAAIEEAKKILTELQTYPVMKPVDAIDKQHALMLLQDPSSACGYSRDAQQEQSRDAYKE